MRRWWWKVLCIIFLGFTVAGGLLMPVPRLFILNETIRNLYYHVPMWFTMIVLLAGSAVYGVKYLRSGNLVDDIYSYQLALTGIFFSVIGLLSGMEWAKFTWGDAWSNDPKELCTALSMLIYFAYLVLRNGMKDEEKRAKISAAYNVFAFAIMIPLIFVLPRLVDSLHPGNGGNPAFKQYDLDEYMRMVFYPAVIGWILLGVWIASLKIRVALVEYRKENSFQLELEKRCIMRKASLIIIFFVLAANTLLAQTGGADMADAMRSNGKIYVVVLVLATIFVGIIAFLVFLDRKITRLEKNN